MSKRLKLRVVIAIVAIISVIIIPVYAAYTDQSKNTPKHNQPDEVIFDTAPVINAGAVSDGYVADSTPARIAAPTATPLPGVPTPTPEIEATVKAPLQLKEAKWIPENPATDQKLLRDNLVEEGTISILIMGRDREAFLDDTMGIVNIDVDKKLIKLIMFSRDTYIEYAPDVLDAVKKIRMDKEAGYYKLNNILKTGEQTEKVLQKKYNRNKFRNTKYDFLAQVIYEKFDIVIDEYVRINTYGFVKLVNIFGSVSVYVPMRMLYYDPEQKLSIDLSKGTQALNGTQAEGFVRYRQGFRNREEMQSGIDPTLTADRTKNQIAFMKAFFQQHAKLKNVTKVPEIIKTLNKNIEHSFGAGELLTTYMTLLNDIISNEFTLETYQLTTNNKKRINGTYHEIFSYESGLPSAG